MSKIDFPKKLLGKITEIYKLHVPSHQTDVKLFLSLSPKEFVVKYQLFLYFVLELYF